MGWPFLPERLKPTGVSVIPGLLGQEARSILLTFLGRLDLSPCSDQARAELQALFERLAADGPGGGQIFCKGRFNAFTGPIESIQITPANPKRK
jgi:hypothetical protein